MKQVLTLLLTICLVQASFAQKDPKQMTDKRMDEVSGALKKEGDGCSPLGVFALPQAFGSLAKPRGLRLPYLRCTSHHLGIDDPSSRSYNQIVDDRLVTCDWVNPETMIPSNGCYALGAVIAHNPAHKPGSGSCIFLHVWQAPGVPTSGCTAMSLDHVRLVLRWLDPAKQPRLVQDIAAR